jgi:hypothetical protein
MVRKFSLEFSKILKKILSGRHLKFEIIRNVVNTLEKSEKSGKKLFTDSYKIAQLRQYVEQGAFYVFAETRAEIATKESS